MAESYKVHLISQEKKEKEMKESFHSELYQKKADIHGTCVKLITDNEMFKEMWEDNFKPMLDGIRPHARIFVVSDKTKKLRVLYEPTSKTVIIKNCNYYGWVKSIALALVADFFEDFTSEHRRYSIHGSFVDFGGKGIGIIGPSGSGKTTLTYGLLLEPHANFVTDDWFFLRLMGEDIIVFSSEKNSYIRDDLAKNWPEFSKRLLGVKKDLHGRSVIDVKRMFGEEKVRERSVLEAIVLLERNRKNLPFRKLNAKEAVRFMVKTDFCNPHQLIRDKRKMKARTEFFTELFSRVPVYLLNTIETPKQSLERIKSVVYKL
jgi:serine kinase of HPr protein (carbohydrate metabolism regulator)